MNSCNTLERYFLALTKKSYPREWKMGKGLLWKNGSRGNTIPPSKPVTDYPPAIAGTMEITSVSLTGVFLS
jgi:hypothetical protein